MFKTAAEQRMSKSMNREEVSQMPIEEDEGTFEEQDVVEQDGEENVEEQGEEEQGEDTSAPNSATDSKKVKFSEETEVNEVIEANEANVDGDQQEDYEAEASQFVGDQDSIQEDLEDYIKNSVPAEEFNGGDEEPEQSQRVEVKTASSKSVVQKSSNDTSKSTFKSTGTISLKKDSKPVAKKEEEEETPKKQQKLDAKPDVKKEESKIDSKLTASPKKASLLSPKDGKTQEQKVAAKPKATESEETSVDDFIDSVEEYHEKNAMKDPISNKAAHGDKNKTKTSMPEKPTTGSKSKTETGKESNAKTTAPSKETAKESAKEASKVKPVAAPAKKAEDTKSKPVETKKEVTKEASKEVVKETKQAPAVTSKPATSAKQPESSSGKPGLKKPDHGKAKEQQEKEEVAETTTKAEKKVEKTPEKASSKKPSTPAAEKEEEQEAEKQETKASDAKAAEAKAAAEEHHKNASKENKKRINPRGYIILKGGKILEFGAISNAHNTTWENVWILAVPQVVGTDEEGKDIASLSYFYCMIKSNKSVKVEEGKNTMYVIDLGGSHYKFMIERYKEEGVTYEYQGVLSEGKALLQLVPTEDEKKLSIKAFRNFTEDSEEEALLGKYFRDSDGVAWNAITGAKLTEEELAFIQESEFEAPKPDAKKPKRKAETMESDSRSSDIRSSESKKSKKQSSSKKEEQESDAEEYEDESEDEDLFAGRGHLLDTTTMQVSKMLRPQKRKKLSKSEDSEDEEGEEKHGKSSRKQHHSSVANGASHNGTSAASSKKKNDETGDDIIDRNYERDTNKKRVLLYMGKNIDLNFQASMQKFDMMKDVLMAEANPEDVPCTFKEYLEIASNDKFSMIAALNKRNSLAEKKK